MRSISFRFASAGELARALITGRTERELELPVEEKGRDGEWVLATFCVEGEATAVAGRLEHLEDGARIVFVPRDWELLEGFARGEVAEPSRRSSGLAPSRSARGNALVVGDDAGLRCVMSAMLAAIGLRADGVDTAETALDRLRRTSFDVVLVDWGLAGMHASELCRRIRRDARMAHVPVVCLTPHGSAHDVEEAFAAGADDYVVKPFRAPELRARVLGLLGRSVAPTELAVNV